jgi:hypothetical protein
MSSFEKVAPFLTNPLALVGFVIFLFYGLLRVMLRARIIPPLAQGTGGQVIKSFLRYGFIIAITAVVLGFAIEAYKVFVGTSAVSKQLSRALTPLVFSITYTMTVPLSAPETSKYLTRLEQLASSLVDDYKEHAVPFSASTAALGTDLERNLRVSIMGGFPDSNGHLVPSSFHLLPKSALLPEEETDKFAWALLRDLSLSLTFYKQQIEPSKFRNIFSIGHPRSDISFISHSAEKSIEYTVGDDHLIVRIWQQPVAQQSYLEYSTILSSTADLDNVQLFIYPNFEVPAIEGQPEDRVKAVKRGIELEAMSLEVGGGISFQIPVKTLSKVTSEWGDDVFIYIFDLSKACHQPCAYPL